ncbi:hypothetical protein AbraIFM66950_001153, partial [Aspergillus brasiliensis]
MKTSTLLLLWGTAGAALASPHPLLDSQVVFATDHEAPNTPGKHAVDEAILSALDAHSDPVAALVSLRPETAAFLAEPRLLHLRGEEKAEWMTEGDKLRLRQRGQKFVDITEHQDFYAEQAMAATAGDPHLPKLSHKGLVKPLFSQIETDRMHDVLEHMTSYYNRYY